MSMFVLLCSFPAYAGGQLLDQNTSSLKQGLCFFVPKPWSAEGTCQATRQSCPPPGHVRKVLFLSACQGKPCPQRAQLGGCWASTWDIGQ